jgi:class 3 adenylate cyclase
VAEDTSWGDTHTPGSGADIRTFLFADMRGYTRFTQEHGDDAASVLAGRFADLVRETVPEFEGELLELRGDEVLCVFRSARQALRASAYLQRCLRSGTDNEAAFPIGVGMGLDAGEAVPTQGGYRGASLNRAARLCASAKPGEILVSDTVVGLAGRVDGVRFAGRRQLRLKGFEEPVRVTTVVPDAALPPVPIPSTARRSKRRSVFRRQALVAGVIVVILVVGGILWATGGHSIVQLTANSVARIDSGSGQIVETFSVGTTPTSIAGFGQELWVANFKDRTVTRVVPAGLTLSAGGAPTGICVGGGYVWVALGFQNQIERISLATRSPALTAVGDGPDAIACAGKTAWVALRNDDAVEPISSDGVAGRPIPVGQAPVALAYAAPYLWVANSLSNSLSQVNVRTDRVRSVPLQSPPSGVAIGPGSVWVASELGNTVTRVDPVQQTVVKTITHGIGEGPVGIAATRTAVWVTSPLAAAISEIDPGRDVVVRQLRLTTTNPDAITSWQQAIWVTGHSL